MAKKAKTVSWRTLTRRAEKAAKKGHKAAATRLRNMAAEARRGERATDRVSTVKGKLVPTKRRNLAGAKRAAKGWATRRANLITEAAAAAGPSLLAVSRGISNGDGVRGRDIAARQAQDSAQGTAPGHGEIVGGADALLAERIVTLARKKGGTDAVQNEIKAHMAMARHQGCVETDKNATRRLIEVQQNIADRIVCGFIAEFNYAEMMRGGIPPDMIWSINSLTIVKIVDALNKAGYRATGKTS